MNTPSERVDPVGVWAATATAILYGSSYVGAAVALLSFTPVTTTMWRGAIGATALALFLLVWHHPGTLPRAWSGPSLVRLVLLGLLGGPAFFVAMTVAVGLAGASVTALVAGLYAVLVALLAVPILRERIEPPTLAALALALGGTAMISHLRLGGPTTAGVPVALLAAVLFATFLVLSRRWSVRYDLPSPTVAFVALALSGLVAGAWAAATGTLLPDAAPRLDAMVAVVWLGLGPGALAAALVVLSMRRLPARRASAFLLLNPLTAMVLAWWLLSERLTAVQLLGAVLVLIAMAAASGRAWRRPQENGRPT